MSTVGSGGTSGSAAPVRLVVRCSGIGITQNPFTGRAQFTHEGVTLRRIMGGGKVTIPWSSVQAVKLTTSDVSHTHKASFAASLAAWIVFAPRFGNPGLDLGGGGTPEEHVSNERVGTIEIHTKATTVWFLQVHHLAPYQVRHRLSPLLPQL